MQYAESRRGRVKAAAACALLLLTLKAVAIDLDGNGNDWNAAKPDERYKFADFVVTKINANGGHQFTAGELKSCLDSVYKKPMSKAVVATTVSTATAGCLAILKNQ